MPAPPGQRNGSQRAELRPLGYTSRTSGPAHDPLSPFARRRLLLGLAAVASGLATRTLRAERKLAEAAPTAAELGFEEHLLEVPGEPLARRCSLFVPTAPVRRVLVLFHGLGETSSEAVGIRAWADRYGLLAAAARLGRPPLLSAASKGVALLTEARRAELNARLAAEPFRGLAFACPFTPNVFRQPSTVAALERYTNWVTDGVLPAVRKVLPLPAGASAIGVDGVSLGGYVSLEVFLRRPEAFGAVGALQGAFGENLIDAYAARIAQAFERVGPRPLRIATSAWDPEHKASERLVARLRARQVSATLAVAPGGHDQRFLREVGSLDLVDYYDRTLPSAAGPPADARGRTP